jgi:exodeoxyribonuclease-5
MREMDGGFGRRIDWSAQQFEAIDAILDWYLHSDRLVFFLSGYAGTGKTTLSREIARQVGGKTLFTSLTGRACAVMARKGCAPVDTIDYLIYARQKAEHCADEPPCEKICPQRCRHKQEKYFDKALNPDSPIAKANLVIADEVSMLGRRMGEDLLSFGTPTLVLGDIGQLPAIMDAAYFARRKPNYHMSEIHRQAAGSPIIQLATKARRGERLRHGHYGGSAVVSEAGDDELAAADQVIVGTHRHRRAINRRMRRYLGYSGKVPEPGEKLVCLKNDRARDLRNGELWWVIEAKPDGNGFVEIAARDDTGRTVEVVAPDAGFHGPGNGGAAIRLWVRDHVPQSAGQRVRLGLGLRRERGFSRP